jgi:hypothetical protein
MKGPMVNGLVLVRCPSRDDVKKNSLVSGDLSHVLMQIGWAYASNKVRPFVGAVVFTQPTEKSRHCVFFDPYREPS